MTASFGVTSMVAPLRRVLVRRPALSGDWAGAGWRTPDPIALQRQHEQFVELLDGLGVEVEVAEALEGQVDSVYMHDPLIVSGAGGIPLNMAKPARVREPGHAADALEAAGVPISARSKATPTPTAATASGSTTPPRPSASATARTSPARTGSRNCSRPRASTSRPTTCRTTRARRTSCTCSRSCRASTESLFVVFEPLAPVRLLQDIRARGIEYLAIDPESYRTMGCNILAVRPGVVVMVDGIPLVRRALEKRGVEVHVYDGSELSLKGDGGPTCLTAPLLRTA